MTEKPKIPATDRALLAEANYVIRKADAILADMHRFYKEMGMEWPNADKMPEVSSR